MADQGFPETLECLGEYAYEVALVQNPDLPGLGKKWANTFLTQNHNKLSVKWSSNLESVCGGAVNPAAIKHWFELLHTQYTQFNFTPHNIYAMDKSGFPFGTGDTI